MTPRQPIVALAFLLAFAGVSPGAAADDGVTPQEIIAKVKEAAAYLAERGSAGLATFDKADSPFVWKDTYVFVWDCAADVIVAHPVTSKGLKISTLKDATGKLFGPDLCKAAARPGGGWAEYQWPKPVAGGTPGKLEYADTPSRKISYMLSVEGQPYQVGAGEYDDTTTVEQLNALVGQ